MAFLIMDFFDKVSKKILPVKAELQKKMKRDMMAPEPPWDITIVNG